jgi:dipeptidyl aminopeptidase/acylaminoacyl peptidase
VTDITSYSKFGIPDIALLKWGFDETVGDPKKEKERLRETSPVFHTDKIQAPVLLAYGALDPKVPISTGRALAKALRKRGKLYDFIVKEDEAHGFHKEENRIEFWKKVDEFLKVNLN